MLTQLSEYFDRLFSLSKHSQYGNELEKFIVSKHPQSVEDVEYWTRRYEYTEKKEWL